MKFEHETTGNVLRLILLVIVALSIMMLIMNTLYYFTNDLYFLLAFIDQGANILFFFTWIIACIIYLVWIYRIHQDVKGMDSNYQITPGGALARILIPFYNIYGLWNVYSTMVHFFNKVEDTSLPAKKLKILIPIYYFLFLGTSILDQFIVAGPFIHPGIILFSYLLDVFLMYVFFLMVKTVMTAMNEWRTYVVEERNPRIEASTEER